MIFLKLQKNIWQNKKLAVSLTQQLKTTTMTTEELEKIITDYALENKEFGTLTIGGYVIQPMLWSEDNNGNINYDTDSMEDEFRNVIIELEDHNENSDFDWDNC